MEGDDVDDVYTVIPTAPEDVAEALMDVPPPPAAPVSHNNSKPSTPYTSHSTPIASNGSMKANVTERNGARQPKEGGRRKDGRLMYNLLSRK